MSAASHKLFHPRETDRAIFELNTSVHNLHELSENIGLALEHQTPFEPPKWRTAVDESVEAVKGSIKAIGASIEEHSERIVDHAKALPGKLPEIKVPRTEFRKGIFKG